MIFVTTITVPRFDSCDFQLTYVRKMLGDKTVVWIKALFTRHLSSIARSDCASKITASSLDFDHQTRVSMGDYTAHLQLHDFTRPSKLSSWITLPRRWPAAALRGTGWCHIGDWHGPTFDSTSSPHV